jgi:3-hydroxy-9,10-secoandrosta-1,3,5(10)-triene-9,17-dione monooxygenase
MDTLTKEHTRIPDRAELVRRARELVPILASRAAQTERDARVADESIAAMNAAGLFRVYQPKRWGGYELGPEVVNEIQMTLAEGCMSSAWLYAVLAVEPFLVAVCDPKMAEDLWSQDQSVLICGTSAGGPTNKTEAVDGGFRISGRWRFASGCDHAAWTFLGGCSVPNAGGGTTDWRVLLPRSDYKIIDTWNVSGLRGTGSRDLVVENAFVPQHRAIKQSDLFTCSGPGRAVNTNPLYRIPFGQVFALSVSSVVLGTLQAMLDAFIAYGTKRVARGVGPTASDPVSTAVCAETLITIRECKQTLELNLLDLMSYAKRDQSPPLTERLRIKYQGAMAVERASLLAARLFKAAGASGIYVDNTPFARMLDDINAVRQHVNNQVEAQARTIGRLMLGGPESEVRDLFL